MQVSLGGRLFCNDCSAYNCFVVSVEGIFVGKMEQPTRFFAGEGVCFRYSGCARIGMARERSPHAETGGECRNHEKVAGQALLTEFCVAKLANVLFSRVFTYSQTDVSFYG